MDKPITATEVRHRTSDQAEQDSLDEMYDALIAFVRRIEDSTPMTQNHYGEYMGLIGAVTGVKNQRGLARAIIKVGANARGVADGFKAATGVEL